MNVSIVVGNPKARSRTWDAAHRIAEGLGAEDVTPIDLVDLGPGLLDWGDETVAGAVKAVRASDLAIIASPTFKATYSGLLKVFLDRFDTGTGLEGVVAVPLMLGAGPGHQLAAEVHLKPLLVELGAAVPAPALYLLDSASQPDPVEQAWVQRWRPVITASVGVAS
ncbi:MAG: reductase [Nocardioidaceae bacterium]|nr:reductase [Nocardioidaceae bacterium]